MKKDIIVFDCDEVLFDFITPFLKFIKSDLTRDDLIEYDFGVKIDNADQLVAGFQNDITFSTLEYFDNNTFNWVNKLSERFDIVILTAIYNHGILNRAINLQGLNISELIISNDKTKYVKVLDPLLVYEDAPKHIDPLLELTDMRFKLLIPDHSWTECYKDNNKIKKYKYNNIT